jgi:diaminopimelate decarboxylase
MFEYRQGQLFCEEVDLKAIAAEYGTPAYIYSRNSILERWREYQQALSGIASRVCFAVKANSNLAVLATLARAGAGFDIVSGGELQRVLAAGGEAGSVVFSGVGKTAAEISFALEKGIHSFNCESEPEIQLISEIAVAKGKKASIALRVNPDVNAKTHPYISTGLREHKFGVDIAAAEEIYRRAGELPGIIAEGVSCHIGSQLLEIDPLLEAADKTLVLVARLRAQGTPIRFLDLGGGLGVQYRPQETRASIAEFAALLRPKLESLNLTLMLEPGRSIVAEAGILLTQVLLVKQNGAKTFVVVDGAMNDLLRPTLYQAHHEITPIIEPPLGLAMTADVVGPVCETGDFFARDRRLPSLKSGDLIALRATGAYGFVLSSNYNSRPRPCELLVDGARVFVARKRETFEDLIHGESLP